LNSSFKFTIAAILVWSTFLDSNFLFIRSLLIDF